MVPEWFSSGAGSLLGDHLFYLVIDSSSAMPYGHTYVHTCMYA